LTPAQGDNLLEVVDVQILGQALGLLIEKPVLVLCEGPGTEENVLDSRHAPPRTD
jgi:hypothetical protein